MRKRSGSCTRAPSPSPAPATSRPSSSIPPVLPSVSVELIGEARYGDGKKESFSGRTDREGRLGVEGLHALPMTLWIEVEDKTAAWESGPIDGSTGEPIDLGKVVLGPSRAGDG